MIILFSAFYCDFSSELGKNTIVKVFQMSSQNTFKKSIK